MQTHDMDPEPEEPPPAREATVTPPAREATVTPPPAPMKEPPATFGQSTEGGHDHLSDLFVPDAVPRPMPQTTGVPKLFETPVEKPPASPYAPSTWKPDPVMPAPVPSVDTSSSPKEPLLTQISRPISWESQRPTKQSRSTTSHRRIKKIETWSVLKFSLLFYSAVMLIGLLAVMILFYAASAAGIVDNTESFIRGVGWPEFRIRAASVFRVTLILGVLQVIFWSAVNLVLTFLYNLVSDVSGGIEVIVAD
ncbi:MAG: DUF3566 domain-containing protein [Actinomycetota bacterium]